MKKRKIKLFVFLGAFITLFFALAISSSALTDQEEADLMTKYFQTENFFHPEAFSTRSDAAIVRALENGTTSVQICQNSFDGVYIAKSAPCISGKDTITVAPSLFGGNIAVFTVWVSMDLEYNLYDYEDNIKKFKFYDSRHPGDYFRFLGYAGHYNVDMLDFSGNTLLDPKYAVFCYVTISEGAEFNNIALTIDIPAEEFHNISLDMVVSLNYFDIGYMSDSLTPYGNFIARCEANNGQDFTKFYPNCLPPRHSTGGEAAYMLGKFDSGSVTEGYEEGKNIGYSEGYQSGKDVGYQEGYDDAYDEGHFSGYSDGYRNGYAKGESQGYQDGVDEGIDEQYKVALQTQNKFQQDLLNKFDQNQKELEASLGNTDGSFTEGFLSGMWNGMTSFFSTVLNGVTFSGLPLMSVFATLLAILIACFVIKMIQK